MTDRTTEGSDARSTEQLADAMAQPAGVDPRTEVRGRGLDEDDAAEAGTEEVDTTSAPGTDAVDEAHEPLLPPAEMDDLRRRWDDVQFTFVDEPREAVSRADAMVGDLAQRLITSFAAEREQLESQWTSGDDVSTEELRVALRRYRSFFERLLAA